MSENDQSQVKRTSALTWYSVYQSQVVGQPKTLWAPEEPGSMLNGYDKDDSVIRRSEERLPLDWNHSKDSDDCNHSKDSDDWNLSKDADIKDGDQPNSNINDPGDAVTKETSTSRSSTLALLRPLSMDLRRMEHPTDEVEARRLVRSRSTIPTWDQYEEFKMPKRYQKPTNIKINTRLSRTFITGAGSDMCKKCGQRLYQMEKINANHSSYHRTCFQCSRCQRLLSLSNFISMDGQLYCNLHFLDVVCNKPNVSESQMPNAVEEKVPHLLPDAEEINKDVTLTSISDMKSRFEIPSNKQIGSEKKAENEEQQKMLRENVSMNAITSSMTRDVRSHDSSKPTTKDSASSSSSHGNMLFEVKPEKPSSRHLKEDEDPFATHPQSTASPPLIKDGENDILPVADAFAKFKNMEHMHLERIPSGEVKPVRKIPPPMWNIKSSEKYSLPENKELGSHLSSYSDLQNAKMEDRLPAVRIHEPVVKNSMSSSSKNSVKSDERNRAERNRAEVNNSEAREDDVPPVGITKQLVAQWKLMDDTPDGTILLHKSTAPVLSAPSSSLGRCSATELALEGTTSAKSNIVAHSLQFGNGFPANEAGHSSCDNTLELVRKHKATKRFRKSEEDQQMVMAAVFGPLDFTRNQLAKFKELEAIAQKSANAYPTPKKDFRWGVKEVSPLHRQIVQPNLIQIGLKTDDYPAVHTLFPHQTDAWNGLKTDDHPGKPIPTHTALADQTDTTEQQSILACMKEALAQFKSMEDLTRPAPNPVLALSKQKAAIATHMKQYHDIIHVSYTMQTVKD